MVEALSTRPVTPGHHADTHALVNVAVSLLDDHLRHCVVKAARLSPEEGSHRLEEANRAIARLVRS